MLARHCAHLGSFELVFEHFAEHGHAARIDHLDWRAEIGSVAATEEPFLPDGPAGQSFAVEAAFEDTSGSVEF